MKLVQALLGMLRSISNYFANTVNNGTHELEKHNEKNINISAVLSEFIRKSEAEINKQLDDLKDAKAKREKNVSLKKERSAFLNTAIEALATMQEIMESSTSTEEARSKANGDYRMTRIHANQAMKVIEMLEASIEERGDLITKMEETIRTNQEEALEIRLQLEQLNLQKDLTITAKGMTKIRLSGQYDLQKLKDIVESEHVLFKVSQEVDEQFKSDGTSVVDSYVNPSQYDEKLNTMLADFRNKDKA